MLIAARVIAGPGSKFPAPSSVGRRLLPASRMKVDVFATCCLVLFDVVLVFRSLMFDLTPSSPHRCVCSYCVYLCGDRNCQMTSIFCLAWDKGCLVVNPLQHRHGESPPSSERQKWGSATLRKQDQQYVITKRISRRSPALGKKSIRLNMFIGTCSMVPVMKRVAVHGWKSSKASVDTYESVLRNQWLFQRRR